MVLNNGDDILLKVSHKTRLVNRDTTKDSKSPFSIYDTSINDIL